MPAPSISVLDAFGVRGAARRLPGGQGEAYLADGIVLKQVEDPAETEWTCGLLACLQSDGFRVPEPIPATERAWVYDGWATTRFISGLRSAAPRWGDVIAAGLRFGDAAELVRNHDDGPLFARTHRWAIADRVTWNEQSIELRDEAAELFEAFVAEFDDAAYEPHFVHGDLSGNVFVDEAGTPVVLDVSPYLRPRRWAAAIVVVDALLWHHANAALARAVAAKGERSLLFRALAFRLVADELASVRGDELPRYSSYRTVAAALH